MKQSFIDANITDFIPKKHRSAGITDVPGESFSLERNIQQLTEPNPDTNFLLEQVNSEFDLYGIRIDTLAFNREAAAFVIIECKRDRNFSVVDQGHGLP